MPRHLFSKPASQPRFLAPEFVQTSAMDCGPAALACVLQGFGIHADFGRLREACQTQLDGTSIDRIEETAQLLGLDAEQVILPHEHLLLRKSRTLPAVVLTNAPNGALHFVVAWRTAGPWVQVMDPQCGRRWMRTRTFLESLYLHGIAVSATDWRAWAASPANLDALRCRAARIGISSGSTEELLKQALGDSSWRSLATLDAALRMTSKLVEGGGVAKGREALRLISSLIRRASDPNSAGVIPNPFHSAQPAPGRPDMLVARGAVAITIVGAKRTPDPLDADQFGADQFDGRRAPAETAAILNAPLVKPYRTLGRMLLADGPTRIVALMSGLLVSAALTTVGALLLQRTLTLPETLVLELQRLDAAILITGFFALLALLELPVQAEISRTGRALETRLRATFLAKLPKLALDYFTSRPTSDMAQRCHSLHALRRAPQIASQLVRSAAMLLTTTAGLLWLAPDAAGWIGSLMAAVTIVHFAVQPAMNERDLRFRTHSGALTRFHLDALLGTVPIRAHAAQSSVLMEHEALLAEWRRTGLQLLRLNVWLGGLETALGTALALALLTHVLVLGDHHENFLLFAYWALSLPLFAQTLGQTLRQVPAFRSLMLRLLEPLGAPNEGRPPGDIRSPPANTGARHGIAIGMRGVRVRLGGRVILDDIDLDIEPGSQVAIVGSSGSGKSSLVGLLLGWRKLDQGALTIDSAKHDPQHLRTVTAWVDPTVQLWSGTLFENILYGATTDELGAVGRTVTAAQLRPVLQHLPDGMQTCLGENGAVVSGGEGQRIRMARGLMRSDARLAILDEPFRGLERGTRRRMLADARQAWPGATLLCVTHDLHETLSFDRVLVLDSGRIVEDGSPEVLAERPGSRYRALLTAESHLEKRLWGDSQWRRWRLDSGSLDAGCPKLQPTFDSRIEDRDVMG
jgi:ABC-type bacteriocin/lantibiotic exporter with double-glycine peptidase domain